MRNPLVVSLLPMLGLAAVLELARGPWMANQSAQAVTASADRLGERTPLQLSAPELCACEGESASVPKREPREAQSPLMNHWNALSRDEKVEVLEDLRRLHTPLALPLLAEVAWSELPQMTDEHLAGCMFAALLASSNEHIDTAIFVADFVAQAASNTTVAEYAENCRTHLVDRRHRLGH